MKYTFLNKFFRISVLAQIILFAVMAAISALIIFSERKHHEKLTIEKVKIRLEEKSNLAQSLIEYSQRYHIIDITNNTLSNLTTGDYIQNASLLDSDGNIIASSRRELLNNDLSTVFANLNNSQSYAKLIKSNLQTVVSFRKSTFILSQDQVYASYLSAVQLHNDKIGVLLINYYIKDHILNEQNQALRWHIIYISVFAFIYIVLAFAFHRSITKRTLKILKAVDSYTKGTRDVRIEVKGNDEIGDLAQGTRNLFERINLSEELLKSKADELEQINTQLKKAKEAAEKSNAAKSEFLANMSHEIRTPMSVILGTADMLIESRPDEQTQQRYLKILKKSCNTLLSLINDILDISRIEAGAIRLINENLDIVAILMDVIETNSLQARQKKLELSFSVAPDLPTEYIGDPNRIKQVLQNLISNAIKYTEKGSISVALKTDPNKNQPGYLLFEVKDTGIGIPDSFKDKIFSIFSQADISTTKKYGGVGLGLSISKHLAEKMNGQIRFESTPDVGSTFFFTLQLEPYLAKITHTAKTSDKLKSDMAETSSTPHQQNDSEKFQVLIVEDTEDIRQLLKVLIESPDLEISECDNGECAVKKVKSHNYDLILMDIQMPIMDGYTALKEIREWELAEKHEHHQIVALTAYAMKEDREKCLNAGFDFYISKPVKRQELLNYISKMKTLKKSNSSLTH